MLPGSSVPDVDIVGIDKVAHVGLFALWAIALRRDFAGNFSWQWTLACGLVFSAMTELLQIAVEGRSFDVTDIIADAGGLVLGLLAGPLLLKWVHRLIR